MRQGLVTRKPITQVSRAGCIHPPASLHPPLRLGAAAALLLQETLASGELHLLLLVPQEVRRYRSRLMQRVEYSVVIAGTDLARFPDPLLEVGRGYSVSIPW